MKDFFFNFVKKMCKMNSFFVTFLLVFLYQKQAMSQLASNREIEELTEELFKLSSPNLLPYVKINLQGKTSRWSHLDDADAPLLTVDETIFDKVPTIKKMRYLYDNYEVDSYLRETVTPNEQAEENDFIDEILNTSVMKAAIGFLQRKGVVSSKHQDQVKLLKTLWFHMYSRSHGGIGSSGFEHVFMNEMKHGSPIGMHNWIYYYDHENKRGKLHDVDYKGYMNILQLGNKAQIIKYRFSFNGIPKTLNSMFVGTPPEVEFALYTVCFEMKFKECPISMGGKKFIIRTFPFNFQGEQMIGSAYPVI